MTSPPSHGDFVTLEKHLESRLMALQETIKAAYPDRNELLGLLDKMGDRVTCLEISKAMLEGKASQRDVYRAEIIGGLVLLIGLVSLVLSIMR